MENDFRDELAIDVWSKHTMDTHCPLFKESPTKTILLFLNLSSNAVPLNLKQSLIKLIV